MILSKQNLQVVEITKPDKNIPVLDCVNINEDGSTVAGNGQAFIAVSPITTNIGLKVSRIYDNKKCSRVNVSSETVKEVLKNIPSDKKYYGLLEHTDVEGGDNKVKFNLREEGRKRSIDGKINNMSYPPFEKIYKRVLQNRTEVKISINAKRFVSMLEAMIKCSSCTDDLSLMYLEFTGKNEVIVRMENPKSKQRCIGVLFSGISDRPRKLEYSKWERSLMDGGSIDSNNSELSKTRVVRSSDVGNFGDIDNSSNSVVDVSRSRTNLHRKGCAKKTGKRSLAIIIDKMCPKCEEYHLASDGHFKWCSCRKGCNYFEEIEK